MDNFQKNIEALISINPKLTQNIASIETNSRYEVFQGKDEFDINFLDNITQEFMYSHPLEELRKFLNMQNDSVTPPVRYFFGIGNGLALNSLLNDNKIKRVVVFEPSVELLYIVFNLIDFSKHIIEKKLILEHSESTNFTSIHTILNHHDSILYVKHFKLESFSIYYEKVFSKEYEKLLPVMTDAFYSIVAGHGNCAIDTLIGIKHHISNLPQMVSSPKIVDFGQKSSSRIAIIVSTGPSLTKQLPLLKQIQNYVTIISLDASFPILEKHNIKPDFVTVIERVPLTADFFKRTKKSFQKDINFILASVAHKDVIDAIKDGVITIQARPHLYGKKIGLDEFGYLGAGMSTANLAHEFAYLLGAKKIVLVGQDLAFEEGGASHANDHTFGETEIDENKHDLFVEGYGGDKSVKTTYIWSLFKNYFERTIASATKLGYAQTINATEGGARIEGAIEMPFKEVVSLFVDKSSKKEKIQVLPPIKLEQQKYTDQYIEKINEWIKDSIDRQEQIEAVFLDVQKITEKIVKYKDTNKLKKLKLDKLLPYLEKIDTIKEFFNDDDFNIYYKEVVQTYIYSMEFDLVDITLINSKTKEENIAKVTDWIMQHSYWLFALAGGIQAVRDTIMSAVKTWDEELQSRITVPEKKVIPIDQKKYSYLLKKAKKLEEDYRKKSES